MTDHQLNRAKLVLENMDSVRAVWIVGSCISHDTTPQSLDLLVACGNNDFAGNHRSILKQISNIWPNCAVSVSDDAVQLGFHDGYLLSMGIYGLEELSDRLGDYSKGLGIHGMHRPWAIGYWLPEALCGDIFTSRCLIDKENANPVLHAFVKPYPGRLAAAIIDLCSDEARQKVCIFEKLGLDSVESLIVQADVATAVTRIAFAQSQVYLRGFKNLEAQAGCLNVRGKATFELVRRLKSNGLASISLEELQRALQK